MCDQDHFENDKQEYEARGLVTRKQFGIMLGTGIAMMLPRVANAAAVVEADVNIKTPDGTADCYYVHPATGTAPGVLVWPDIFGLRPAFPHDGQTARRIGLFSACGKSVLPHQEGTDCGQRRRNPNRGLAAAGGIFERDDAYHGREGVHRMVGSAIGG